MGRHTTIQWADSSVNPVMGCDGCELWSVDPRGFRICYAGIQHEKHQHKGFAKRFLEPEMFAGRMAEAAKLGDLAGKSRADKPWLNGYPRTIFVSDMGDSLSKRIPFEFLGREIVGNVTSDAGRRHIWIWLTKRPTRMCEFDQWMADRSPDERLWLPANLWVATSVTMPKAEARVDALRKVGHEGTTRLISFEPILKEPDWDRCLEHRKGEGRIHWAIFGGASGEPNVVPAMDVDVIRRGVLACRRHGVAAFVKQLGRLPLMTIMHNGKPIKSQVEFHDSHAGEWEEWRAELADLMVRELPAVRGMKSVEPVSAASESQPTSESPASGGLFGVDRAAYAGGGH